MGIGSTVAGKVAVAVVAAIALGSALMTSAAKPAVPAIAAELEPDEVVACAGADGVLKLAPDDLPCPVGARRLEIAGPERKARDFEVGDPWDTGDSRSAASSADDPLDSLGLRIERLEKRPVFEVLDDKRRVIFAVGPGRVDVYGSKGRTGVTLRAGEDGSSIAAIDPGGRRSVAIGVKGGLAGLRAEVDGQIRVDLGSKPAGNYTLTVSNGSGTVAGIGESRAGTGLVLVGDELGLSRASISVLNAKGAMQVFGAVIQSVMRRWQATARDHGVGAVRALVAEREALEELIESRAAAIETLDFIRARQLRDGLVWRPDQSSRPGLDRSRFSFGLVLTGRSSAA